ncbi:unnamed protein product [Paramecium pentaurelia]|uniref:DNA polymerase epsilon catalytic subunit n=2 Tax=Paramecium pentaurelia TaxID=43138 RepID=A0A8S1X5H7_9CILI|nr:unnamed protein product [Paramecium pentaurelia]
MRKQKQNQLDEIELRFNVEWVRNQKELQAWVANMKVISTYDESEKEFTALLVYVITQNGEFLKLMYDIPPYFYVECNQEHINELAMHLENKYEKQILKVDIIERVDLDKVQHITGGKEKFIKLQFRLIQDLVQVRNQLKARSDKNRRNFTENELLINKPSTTKDILDQLIGVREYDVPYHCRVCIDTGLRCCKWFKFVLKERRIAECIEIKEMISMPELKFLAFDIETYKQPLKFPDAKNDQIMMISITHSQNSILITNMQTLGQEVQSFDYAPKPEFATQAIIYNEPDEKSLLLKFFQVILDYKPIIISSFNGDRFDWPYIEERCLTHGFYLEQEIGIKKNEENNEYYGRYVIHMDCFAWVERDAYLPQGSHGLKAVTKAKLGYQPIEVDPEKMVSMAMQDSQQFAGYSISDSVATYWLYRKHIHDFILALCTIIPLSPDEVLRKGSGTLCECLLMAQAFQREIIFPNKTTSSLEKFHNGHLIDSETYIGGKVECLRSGIYRSDIDVEFKIDKECMQSMWSGVDSLIRFVGKIENETFSEEEIEKCSEKIRSNLDVLIGRGEIFKEKPLIYHLDVAAMYPNIILTNRLQPVSIVDESTCSQCFFNQPQNKCQRQLEWQWKGELFPLKRSEFEFVKQQLEQEQTDNERSDYEEKKKQLLKEGQDIRKLQLKGFSDLSLDEQAKRIKQRVIEHCKKSYKSIHQHSVELRKDTVCMRENDFYVQTVRNFRDRRYEFKELVKVYKNKLEQAKKDGVGVKECHDFMALYESLQLAHKIILNSFYGYVMRKGARWYSMPMAGIVTHMGSQIISTAKQRVDQIGLPLELDTDGIWCLLPSGFPEDFVIKCQSGRNLKFSYPCYILNELVYEKYKNNQYQWLKNPETLEYGIKSEMSIFFEVDGPYRCMIIPAAREENKQLKKRYVVYNKNGSIAEVKGFEIKRRGELQIIKQFQQDLFSEFLKGTNLTECYQACAEVGKKLLKILMTGGEGIPQQELLDLIGESRVLSKEISEYDNKKGVAITAGKRIAEYLGSDQIRGGSLNCQYIITKLPHNTPVNERSIPLLIFESSFETRKKYLRKWLKEPQLQDDELTLCKIVDWDYYIERLKNTILKLLVIPAALQNIENPIPEVDPPEWLLKKLREKASGLQQTKINKYFFQINKLAHQLAELKFQPIDIEENKQLSNKKKLQINEDISKQLHNPYNMETDFKNFLKAQKQIWTKEFRNKQQNKNINGRGNLKNMIKFNKQQLFTSVWQVLQFYEVEPGLFLTWILLENGTLTNVQIQVDRTIYTNQLTKEPEEQTIKKSLPRDKKVHYLYQLTMDESAFQFEHKQLFQYEANPNTESLYEHKIPLIFKLVTELGGICKVNRQYVQKQKNVFKFEDLQIVYEQPNQQQYLDKFQNSLYQFSYIIFHLQLQDNFGIWSVFYNDEVLIIIVRKSEEKLNRQDLNQYTKSVQEQFEFKRKQLWKQYKMGYHEKNKITVQAMKDDKLAIDYISNNFETRGQGMKLCILKSNKELTYLQSQGLQFLCLKIPTFCIPNLHRESRKEFQWDINTIKQQLEDYCKLKDDMESYIKYSKYVKVPLCNLTSSNLGKTDVFKTENENLNYTTDIFFQRVLRQKTSCLSWYGSGLGRDNRDLVPTEFTKTYFDNPGIYIGYTCEIDILHFSINTIAQSEEIKNLDKEASSLVGQNGKSDMLDSLDELGGAKIAFRLLQMLVSSWLDDIYAKGEKVSDDHILNINIWIYSGQSPLYDPYLGKLLNRLNFKFFSILTTKLMQLGVKIVKASPTKLLLYTGKQQKDMAKSQIEYIINTLRQSNLFKHVTFQCSKFFTSLIYKDKHNYLGKDVDYQSDNDEFDYKLKLADFLPSILSSLFVRLIFEILLKIEELRSNQLEQIRMLPTNLQILRMTNLQNDIINILVQFISNSYSQRIYDIIEEYDERYKKEKQNYELYLEQQKTIGIAGLTVKMKRINIEDDEEIEQEDQDDYEQNSFVVADDDLDNTPKQIEIEEELECQEDGKVSNFPKLWYLKSTLGARIDFHKQELIILRTFIYLCAILSVDEEVHQQMKKIRNVCCKIVNISESSKEAEFEDPCFDLILQNVPCYKCYMVSEVNVFKDLWKCEGCKDDYDSQTMEKLICQFVEQQLLFYQIQDLYCVKCKQTQDYSFQKSCQCSAQFQIKLDQFEKCFIRTPTQLFDSLLQLAIEKNLHGLKTLISSINI